MIQQVARAVGDSYSVDLKNPDVVVLVEIYRNVLGVSVVDGEYERLKRYNLAEIYEPSPKTVDKGAEQAGRVKASVEGARDVEAEV